MEHGRAGDKGRSLFGDSPAMVIAEKELKTAIREPEMLIRGAVVFVLRALWPVLTVFMDSGFDPMVVPTSLVLLGSMMGLILNPNSLGTEAGRLWMLRTSPLSPADLFLGKWLLSAVVCIVLLTALVLTYFTLGWLTVLEALSLVILAVLIGLLVPGMSVGIGFLFPDFERAKRNRPGLMGLFALLGLAYTAFLPAIIAITYDILNLHTLALESMLAVFGLAISALLGAGMLLLLYRNLKRTYEDLELVQGGNYI
jgi:MFS family permease